MRNFFGAFGSSVRNQPPRSTALTVGLNNSMKSALVSEWLSTSLTSTGGSAFGGSAEPGEPPPLVLARQLNGLLCSKGAVGFTGTREKSKLSGVTGHGAASW